MTKKEYYKQYAATHPELKEKARLRGHRQRQEAKAFREIQEQVDFFKTQEEKGSFVHESRLGLYLELILVPSLLACFTYLLLNEMVAFYAQMGGNSTLIWTRAIGLESAVLFFSYLGHSSTIRSIIYKAMAVLACIFSIYSMNAKTYSDSVTISHLNSLTEQSLLDLETAIKEKRSLRDELRSKGHITEARKLERTIDALRNDVSQLRNRLLGTHPVSASLSISLGETIFRIILMIFNILLADRFRVCLTSLSIFNSKVRIPKLGLRMPTSVGDISKAVNRQQQSMQGIRFDMKTWFTKWTPVRALKFAFPRIDSGGK